MRGEKPEFEPRDRMRASELLAKAQGDFNEKEASGDDRVIINLGFTPLTQDEIEEARTADG
jgi:hypothetical protein